MGSLVSLVMTDIVGSTRRWAVDDTAMVADLEQHDRALGEVVAAAGGRVFKHTGDGMIAVFDDPVAAVGAAASIQRTVGDTAWQHTDGLQVRAAVHSGVVYERDGDMFGTAVNKLARILGVCSPGGVLVSNVVANLLAERAPEGLLLRPVGEVTLAGFSAPEALHAVSGAGVAEVNAPAVARSERRGGELPSVDEELVGRVEELAAIWDALGRTRLVTLVGVGGMGKTRLALEVAAGGVDAFAGGVWWIDLSTATSADAVIPVALEAVGALETPGRTALEAFCDRFASRSALIVVDNCEHVLATAGELVKAVRAAAPEVRIVATSREALGVRGEQLVPVGSLPGVDGVALFIERALAVRPDLDADASRGVIERLCSRLDGIPLAIELAAARCRSLTPSEIDELLDDRFRLLRGGRQGVERHRTLQAAVAWSYEMLDSDERAVFTQMAVFAGGTLIDGLVVATGMDRFDVVDVVDRLVARSMLVATATPFGTRYHQLETLRQFAEDRLVDAGDIERVRDQHLGWVHQLAMWVASCEGTPRAGDAFRRFCVEVDNLRVAVVHAVATGRHHRAHEIVAAVVFPARCRPVFEVVDWVRPLQLDGDWTDAAAVCAASGAVFDFLRVGGSLQGDGPIGGVPERFLDTNLGVGLSHVFVQASRSGGWRAALDRLNRITKATDRPDPLVDSLWLWTQNMRQIDAAGPDNLELDDFDEIRRRGYAAVEAARLAGDDLAYGRTLTYLAFALEYRYPEEAMAAAVEAAEVFDRLGALYFREIANAAYYRCIGQVSGGPESGSVSALRALRSAIIAALESGDQGSSTVLAMSAFRWIAEVDPDCARALVAVDRRGRGSDLSGWLLRFGIPIPDDWSEWEQRARHLSLDAAVRGVLAALDLAIDAAEAAAAGGDS